MNLARHYRTLGLRQGATAGEVKRAYRQLVRQYHPDINPDAAAVERFIKINDAYTVLFERLQASEQQRIEVKVQADSQADSSQADSSQADSSQIDSSQIDSFDSRLQDIRSTLEKLGFDTFEENGEPVVVRSPATAQNATNDQSIQISKEQSLKQDTYEQLKELLKRQKFPRAIALIEGLAHRLPQDSEIVQWQAIVYQRWGRQLIQEGQTHKARIYLKKALRTDPNNRSLWREVNRDFWQLASLGL